MTASEGVLSSNAAAAAVLSGAEDCRIGGMVRHLFEILRLWLGTGIPPSPYKTIQIEIRVHNFGKTNRVRILPVAPAQSIYASPGGSGTAPAGAALLLLTAFSSASEKLVVKASHAAVKTIDPRRQKKPQRAQPQRRASRTKKWSATTARRSSVEAPTEVQW